MLTSFQSWLVIGFVVCLGILWMNISGVVQSNNDGATRKKTFTSKNVYFVRHVRSEWNECELHNSKEHCNTLMTLIDAQVSDHGLEQLKQPLDEDFLLHLQSHLVNTVASSKINIDTNNQTSNKIQSTTTDIDVIFLSSNLKRAAVTLLRVCNQVLKYLSQNNDNNDNDNSVGIGYGDKWKPHWIITNSLQESGHIDTISKLDRDKLQQLQLETSSDNDYRLKLNQEIVEWLITDLAVKDQSFITDFFDETVESFGLNIDILMDKDVDEMETLKDVNKYNRSQIIVRKNEIFLNQICDLDQRNIILSGHSNWFLRFAESYFEPSKISIDDSRSNISSNSNIDAVFKKCNGDKKIDNTQIANFQVNCFESGRVKPVVDKSSCILFPNL